MTEQHPWISDPVVSAQLARLDPHLTHEGSDAVCIMLHDPNDMEIVHEMFFSDIDKLQTAADLLSHFAQIGRYMEQYGYEATVAEFGLDDNNFQSLDEDLDSAIDRILEEGL